jgi:AraC-like DNA-binding protein
MNRQTSPTTISELSWLSEVKESGPRLNPQWPIWVRRLALQPGLAIPHPECHPYCELGLHLGGSGSEYVGQEKIVRQPGDLFLAGPGMPHWFKIARYPLTGIVIYFLPSLLCEFGPEQDGLCLLRRFTSKQSIERRVVRPPAALGKRLTLSFERICAEFGHPSLGSEMRLRTLLIDILVELVRWERREGREVGEADFPSKWRHVNRALHYLRENFAVPVYAHDVAGAAGVSESRLKVLFRQALGVPWSRYIQGYRVQQAIALLGTFNYTVTEAAFAVGFESVSHFNATFRSFTGLAPGVYLRKAVSKTANIQAKTGSRMFQYRIESARSAAAGGK